jgi:hypothetical protein
MTVGGIVVAGVALLTINSSTNENPNDDVRISVLGKTLTLTEDRGDLLPIGLAVTGLAASGLGYDHLTRRKDE